MIVSVLHADSLFICCTLSLITVYSKYLLWKVIAVNF